MSQRPQAPRSAAGTIGGGTKVPAGAPPDRPQNTRSSGTNSSRRNANPAWRGRDNACQIRPPKPYMAFNPAMKAPLHGPTMPSWANDDSHDRAEQTDPFRRSRPPARPRRHCRARAARARARRYLADLNPEQREAVETLDGPVLVLAGAGTGKTRVLTTRIAHILATAARGRRNPLGHLHQQGGARDEAARRQMVGQAVEGMPWLGTFHSIGVKILRRHAELVGLKSDFTILDTDDQIRLLKQLLAGRGHRREALAGADAGRADRRLEEPRPDARRRCRPAKPRRSPTARAASSTRRIRSG